MEENFPKNKFSDRLKYGRNLPAAPRHDASDYVKLRAISWRFLTSDGVNFVFFVPQTG